MKMENAGKRILLRFALFDFRICDSIENLEGRLFLGLLP
jgi:hypothetical protein